MVSNESRLRESPFHGRFTHNDLTNTQKNRFRKEPVLAATPFAEARDELFQHIMRCGVVGSAEDDQKDWFDATIEYLAGRYHELSPSEVAELRVLGERFAQPPKAKLAV